MSTGKTIPVWQIGGAGVQWSEECPAQTQDVIVIGAGVAGLTAAICLLREGRRVLLVDREGFGAGESGRTTAHLASALDDRFGFLAKHHGLDGARVAAASHAAAIDWIEEMAGGNDDCDFTRVPGYLFSHDGALARIQEEAKAAEAAGLSVTYLHAGAPGMEALGPVLRFERQARVDMGRYLDILGREAADAGCAFLKAEATKVEGQPTPAVVVGDQTIAARAVVVATNVPFHDTTSTFHKQAPYRTYAVAARLQRDSVPDALYWDDGDPYHYVRLHRSAAGETYLIVGGGDHKTGQADDPTVYRSLQAWTCQRFEGLGSFVYAWSGQVLEPVDGLAYLGADPNNENVYLITGDSGNGITHGTLGGMIVCDLIQGRNSPWAALYDPGRRGVGTADWIRENANVAVQYLDWVRPAQGDHVRDLARGAGRVIRRGLHRIAVYRDATGDLHAHNARCPHLGCVVRWSSEEKSWDCPCHGSRFEAASGAVLNGPSDAPLPAFDLESDFLEVDRADG